jgi:hypothetical protein
MIDHLQHSFKETKGQAPNDVTIGIPDDDPRKP